MKRRIAAATLVALTVMPASVAWASTQTVTTASSANRATTPTV